MPQPCGDPELYALSGIPYIKNWHSLLIQALYLTFLVFSTILQWYFLGKTFWTRPLSFCKVGLLAIMMVLVMIPAAGMYGPEATLLSMYIRFLIPIVFTRPLRMCSRMIARIMPTCANIAVLLVIFLLLSAYVGMLLFGKKTSEFKDYPTSLLNLMVLLTTANNPNVWAPAYTTNRWAFVFFFIFLVVGLFFLCNLAFMVIYSNYKVEIANEVAKRTSLQYATLDATFTLLDRLQQNSINGSSLIALLHAMNLYRDIPDFQLHEHNIFFALGKNEHSTIDRDEFETVYSLIALEIEQQVQSLPQPAGPFRKMISKFWWLQFSDHPPYTHFIWAATSVSLVLAILERRAEEDDALKRNLILAEFSMGWLFLLDTLIKIVLQSWSVYWQRNLNRFDFVFALLLLFLIFTPSSVFRIEPHWVSFLFIAKAFRVLSLVTLISRWGLMAHTLINLLPATAPILILQFLICSSFSLLGVHLFGGKVYIGHPLLENTEYANGHLFAFNYNDYASALVTSFNLCVVNNWYVIMDAYAFVTETPWSRSFFIVFWAVAVAFSLPIVVAFFVEAFVKQMEKGVLLQVPQGASVLPSESTYTRKLSYHDLYKDIVKNPSGPMSTMSI